VNEDALFHWELLRQKMQTYSEITYKMPFYVNLIFGLSTDVIISSLKFENKSQPEQKNSNSKMVFLSWKEAY